MRTTLILELRMADRCPEKDISPHMKEVQKHCWNNVTCVRQHAIYLASICFHYNLRTYLHAETPADKFFIADL
jgi:hypothetical protein